jgi:transcriptional regulator GlxA family with amidase domain
MRRLDAPHTVRSLASAAGMSPRTFIRRFRDEVGASPIQWLTAQRIRAARERLEGGDEPVETIARRCGFAGADGLRKHFTRFVGVTPYQYRRTFRA